MCGNCDHNLCLKDRTYYHNFGNGECPLCKVELRKWSTGRLFLRKNDRLLKIINQ